MHQHIALLDAIRALGATVTITALSRGIVGDCDPINRLVRVSRRLTPVEMTCTIAHELGHIDAGDIPTGDDQADAPIEAAADEWAARLLIPPAMLAAVRDQARDEREMCELLQVDERTLAAAERIADREAALFARMPRLATLLPGQHGARRIALVAEGQHETWWLGQASGLG